MNDEEKQAWELENGKVWLGDTYQPLLVNLNLTPIYEANNGKSRRDGEETDWLPENPSA